MSTIKQFYRKEDIQEQASLWVSRIDRGLSEEVGSEVEVTNTVVVETLIELEVDKVRSYFWSVR